MRRRQFQTLEYKTEAIERKALDLERKNRSDDELEFFSVHGYWPEAADVVEPIESCFTTHGLKTTLILERVEPARTKNRCCPRAGARASRWTTMTLLKSRIER